MSKFCENCGNTLRDEAQFCPKCGEKVKEDYSLEVDLNDAFESKPQKNPWLIAGIVSAAAVIISVAVILMLFNSMKNKPEAQGTAAVIITETKDENVQETFSEDITGKTVEDKSEENKDADQTQTAETTVQMTEATSKVQTDKKLESNILTPTENDFKKLKEILDNDGGFILNNNFNYKTSSKKDFVDVANSRGFVPAYIAYIDKNAFSEEKLTDIDGDGYWNMPVSLRDFNWILRNVYNYSGKEITEPVDENHQIVLNDKIYFWLPPDEGGVPGEFRRKSFSEKNGEYTIQYDLYVYDPYMDEYPYDYQYYSTYTVKASLKEVDSVDGTQKIRVWSIYSIEHTEN